MKKMQNIEGSERNTESENPSPEYSEEFTQAQFETAKEEAYKQGRISLAQEFVPDITEDEDLKPQILEGIQSQMENQGYAFQPQCPPSTEETGEETGKESSGVEEGQKIAPGIYVYPQPHQGANEVFWSDSYGGYVCHFKAEET